MAVQWDYDAKDGDPRCMEIWLEDGTSILLSSETDIKVTWIGSEPDSEREQDPEARTW
jgi:hypothetical protein